MTSHNFRNHTFTITKDSDGTFSVCIDNRITCGGWAYRSSAFEYAQHRIVEIDSNRR